MRKKVWDEGWERALWDKKGIRRERVSDERKWTYLRSQCVMMVWLVCVREIRRNKVWGGQGFELAIKREKKRLVGKKSELLLCLWESERLSALLSLTFFLIAFWDLQELRVAERRVWMNYDDEENESMMTWKAKAKAKLVKGMREKKRKPNKEISVCKRNVFFFIIITLDAWKKVVILR